MRAIVRALEEAGIPYRVIGATALAAHGVARATQDVDLLVTDVRVLQQATWRAARIPGFEIEVRMGSADDPLTGVVRIDEEIDEDRNWETPLVSVDIVVIDQPWASGMVERRGPTLDVDGLSLESVALVDLVLLKLYAGGAKDQADLRELLAQDSSGWRQEVQAQLGALPPRCRELWNSLAGAA